MTKSNKSWYVVLAKDNKSDNYCHVWWDGPNYEVACEKFTEAENYEFEKFVSVKLVSLPADMVEKHLDGLQRQSDETLFACVQELM